MNYCREKEIGRAYWLSAGFPEAFSGTPQGPTRGRQEGRSIVVSVFIKYPG